MFCIIHFALVHTLALEICIREIFFINFSVRTNFRVREKFSAPRRNEITSIAPDR